MKYLICLFALSFFSFQYKDTAAHKELMVVGTWVQTGYGDKTYTYERAQKLDRNQPGLTLKADGTLIKRQNAGWCGTPPITYANNAGHWQQKEDGTLNLEYSFWGGTGILKLDLVEINETQMRAKVLEYETVKPDAQ